MNYRIYITDDCPKCLKALEILQESTVAYCTVKVDVKDQCSMIDLEESTGSTEFPYFYSGNQYLGGLPQIEKLFRR